MMAIADHQRNQTVTEVVVIVGVKGGIETDGGSVWVGRTDPDGLSKGKEP